MYINRSADLYRVHFQPARPGLFDIPEHTSTTDLVRRHSMSLLDRTPPGGSLADELLSTQVSRPGFLKAKSMLADLKDMDDRLSEFGSCKSTSSESGGDEHVDEKLGYKSANEKKRIKRKKRKLKLTSGKEDFFKKPNLVL